MDEIDWQNPFRPTDFSKTYTDLANETAAREANKRFREIISTCPIAYEQADLNYAAYCPLSDEDPHYKFGSRMCRLICIEKDPNPDE